MSGKHKSTLKRRWTADPTSLMRVMARIQPFTPEERTRLELPIRVSFEALKTGVATPQDFHDIHAAINVAFVRAESIDPVAESAARTAQEAMIRTWERYLRVGKLGLDGPAMSEIEVGIDLHEQLVKLSTPIELVNAAKEVIRRGYGKQVRHV